MKLPLKLGMFSQNLIKTIKFSPEVMLALVIRIFTKKIRGDFYGSKNQGGFLIRADF